MLYVPYPIPSMYGIVYLPINIPVPWMLRVLSLCVFRDGQRTEDHQSNCFPQFAFEEIASSPLDS